MFHCHKNKSCGQNILANSNFRTKKFADRHLRTKIFLRTKNLRTDICGQINLRKKKIADRHLRTNKFADKKICGQTFADKNICGQNKKYILKFQLGFGWSIGTVMDFLHIFNDQIKFNSTELPNITPKKCF